jgi:segregation and condensation protein A
VVPAEPGARNGGEPEEVPGAAAPEEPPAAGREVPAPAGPDEPEPTGSGEPSATDPGDLAAAEPGEPSAAGSREPESAAREEPAAAGREAREEPETGAPEEFSAAEPGGLAAVESGALAAAGSREPESAGREEPPAAGSGEPEVVGPGGPSLAESRDSEVGESEDLRDGVFKVRLSNFEGPFDLLLQLISKHKLDVTEVALSKVTDEFMAHIRAMGPDWDLDQTTEFLVVAATLLDLKAARLLPAAEVEDEADLALLEARDLLFARLLQYRAYKQIADIFNRRLDDEARRYPRTVGLEPHHAELLPEVVISIGPEGFAKLAVKAMQPKAKPQVYVDHIHAPLVSVQEQAGIVVARLRELGRASFSVLVEDTDDTLTVVARFLALLELYREKAVALDQETALGDLIVRWTGGDADAAPMVTDEFDRPPEVPKEPEASKEGKKA